MPAPDPDPDRPAVPRLALAPLLAEPLPPTLKGLPDSAVGRPLAALGTLGLAAWGRGIPLPLPAAVLHDEALAHNAAWMRDFCARAGVELCPHGKTTMAPQLFQRQLDAGAWGITVATAAQLRTAAAFGVPRLLLANQLVDEGGLAVLSGALRSHPSLDALLLVDSEAGLGRLVAHLRDEPVGRPVGVLVEIGAEGGRAGVRGVEAALTLARAVAAHAPWVALRGIEAYEGVFGLRDDAPLELAVHGLLEQLVAVLDGALHAHLFAPGDVLLTAGGSQFFDLAARALATAAGRHPGVRPLLRSGCYLSHDSLHYERLQARLRGRAGDLWGRGPGLRPAVEVWSVVQSVPEPGRAVCAVGKRDLSHDVVPPQPMRWWRPGMDGEPRVLSAGTARLTALFDQHAVVTLAGNAPDWQVGDRVAFGIGHPCTTFDRWPLLFTVDARGQVTGGVRTFF